MIQMKVVEKPTVFITALSYHRGSYIAIFTKISMLYYSYMPTLLEKLIVDFLEYLEIEKGRSLKTVENYDRYLKKFIKYANISSVSNISDELVRNYRLSLNRTKSGNKESTLGRKTQNYYLIALRNFLKYLAWRGIKSMPAERIQLAKTAARDLDLITIEELERLLASPAGSDIKALRDNLVKLPERPIKMVSFV